MRWTLTHLVPHLTPICNVALIWLLISARSAIRGGDEIRHRRDMLRATVLGVAFLALYVAQTAIIGHRRFPGDDWVRSFFLLVLGTHTAVAVLLAPVLPATIYFALKDRRAIHKKLVRFTYPAWLYVSVTAIIIYVMNNFVRPA